MTQPVGTHDQPGDRAGSDGPDTESRASEERAAEAPMRVISAADGVADEIRSLVHSPSVRVIRGRVVKSMMQLNIDVGQARARASRIVADAEAQAAEICRKATDEGRSAGYREVLETLANARREYAGALDAAEDDMVEMAFRLASRIVGEAIEQRPARVRNMVAKVLRHARGKRDIVVVVSPKDREVLEDADQAMARQVDGVTVHFKADPSIRRGGCVIQTESGRIDGRIETQLKTLQRALQGDDS